MPAQWCYLCSSRHTLTSFTARVAVRTLRLVLAYDEVICEDRNQQAEEALG